MNSRILICALFLFALSVLATPLCAESAEASFGADGAAMAIFFNPASGRFFAGMRVGLGFEWADFILNDPSLSLAVRYEIFTANRWAWWFGAEAGAVHIDTGYDRFVMPFAGASAGIRFHLHRNLHAFIETGGRFGQRNLMYKESLDFLDVRRKETVFIDPLVLRFGLTLNFFSRP